MQNKFEPGQRVVVRENDNCIYGNILSVNKPLIEVQFDGFPQPTLLGKEF